MESIKNGHSNEKEKNKFSKAEKRKLISAMKRRKVIWDKSEKLHSNRAALKEAWREVAQEIGKTEESCRVNWKSVLDSKRYYTQRRKATKKFGKVCDLEIFTDESTNLWEFSEDLQFLPDSSENKTSGCSSIFQSSQKLSFEETELPHTSASSNGGNPSYTYKNETTPKSVYLKEMLAGVSKVADALEDIAKTQKETIKNAAFLNYVDTLLLKLPIAVAEEMQSNIITMLYEQIYIDKQRQVSQ